jgi:hypothetical protein
VPIDATWSEYINERLGFAIRVPNTIFQYGGDCVWSEADGDHSYRPVWAELPVAIFEDVDRVYITAASYVEFTQPTPEAPPGYRTFFAGCERFTNTIERARAMEMTSGTWEIVVWDIENEADLEALIDEVYGEDCQLEGTVETDVPGVLRVRVLGNGPPPEVTTCWVNYMYVFLYSPGLGRAATWITGQSTYFVIDPDTHEGYDYTMEESFRFLP